LENVTQTIGASGVDGSTKTQFVALIKQLSDALANVPAAQEVDAEAISDAAEEVVAKATNPNKKTLEISGKGLLEAAKGSSGRSTDRDFEIVKTVSHFAGIVSPGRHLEPRYGQAHLSPVEGNRLSRYVRRIST
jgi:hypothetical protein